jgi:hypothetical protein
MTYEIDGTRFSTLEEFFEEICRVLIPDAIWGHNLDAFNDILRSSFGTPEEGFSLVRKNSALSRQRLGYPETVRQLELRLARGHPYNRESVAKDLQLALKNEGPTVFDWLIQIIRLHGPGGDEEDDHVELILA